MVAAINSTPPAVATGPPMFGVPKDTSKGSTMGSLWLIVPRGTSQRCLPLARS